MELIIVPESEEQISGAVSLVDCLNLCKSVSLTMKQTETAINRYMNDHWLSKKGTKLFPPPLMLNI